MHTNLKVFSPARFSVIRSVNPPHLSKSYRLVGGELVGHAAAQMWEGVAYRRSVEDVTALAQLFAGWAGRRDWALTSGITPYAKIRIVTKRELVNVDGSAVARSKEHFAFPDGPGLLCLDYDPYGEALTANALHAALISCCPWLAGVGALITASATSHIYDSGTGKCLKGPGGLHLYLLIKRMAAIGSVSSERT
jgi:hypothetical protein